MSRYKLGKLQIQRLIDGKYVVDGHGRKFTVDKQTRKMLKELYSSDKYDFIIENREIKIIEKGVNV